MNTSILFGALVGVALGLTGGGGSIFAVPLLIYGQHVNPHDAVLISLAAVGLTAASGALSSLRAGLLDLRAGSVFAAGGVLGAPLGTRLGALVPGDVLVIGFALLMLVVAVHMWHKARGADAGTQSVGQSVGAMAVTADGPACRYAGGGRLQLRGRCAAILGSTGLGVGVLSGFFGVGGGFVIVPALLLVTRMGIHRAVATSLFVIALVGLAGVGSVMLRGHPLPWTLTGLFVLGGFAGMFAGRRLASRLGGSQLQRGFAGGMLGVAAFMLATRL